MSKLQNAARFRKTGDEIKRFMNSYYKSIVFRGEMDPIQIHFADMSYMNLKMWLELNDQWMDSFEYRVYSKYLDMLRDFIFTKTIQGRRLNREAKQ